MMLLLSTIRDTRGVAIVAVTMVMVVVALLGGAIISQTNHNAQLSNRALNEKQAVYLAESAKERGYQEIIDDIDFTKEDDPGQLDDVPIQGGTYKLFARTIQETPNKIVELTATGFSNSGDAREISVVAEVIRENVNVWNNAIFGGAGETGGVINGNVAIHGSVHLLGDGVGEGGNSIEALDLSGASLIHNNYEGMPAELQALVPALPTEVFGGEEISTIGAKLRVKNGAVGVSGNSEIGEANITGNGMKETMNGIYIETNHEDTRWTGNQVVDGVPNPDSVSSDNGTNALYDLGDAVSMPMLSDPFESYATYTDYFSANALHLPTLVLDGSNAAAIAIEAHYAANGIPVGVSVAVDTVTGEFTVDDTNTESSISYNPAAAANTAVLSVNGMLHVDGNITIGEKHLDVSYTGKGTMYAAGDGSDGSGNIDIHSNVLPIGTFPTTTVLGLMALNNIDLATGPGDSQLMLVGAFYGQSQITSTKQNQVAGTFVCAYFDMGTNVPKIYQVPALADNLPPGMIGSEPIWVTTGFAERSWQIKVPPMAGYTSPGNEYVDY